LNGVSAARLPLYSVDFNGLIIAASSTIEYQNAITDCAGAVGEYNFSDAQDEVSLESICDFNYQPGEPPSWFTEYDEAYIAQGPYIGGAQWIVQAGLREWSLNMQSSEIDTTAVGEKFGDAVKSIVTGGGTMDFLVDRQDTGNLEQDSTALLQLLLLTEKGCKAAAQFWMIQDAVESANRLLPGDLYYETELLVTGVAVNTRAEDVIAGSLNFVTVGGIALKMGTN
jgi:hypothetical protein